MIRTALAPLLVSLVALVGEASPARAVMTDAFTAK